MKKIFIILLLLCVNYNLISQEVEDARLIIGVTPFTATSNPPAIRFSPFLTERVVDLLTKSQRYQVINLTSPDALKQIEERSQENYKAEKWVDTRGQITPDYYVASDITTLRLLFLATEQTYKVSLSFTLKLVETKSGRIIGTQTFQSAESKRALSPDGSVLNSFLTMEDDIYNYFKNNFIYKTLLVKVLELKGEEAKKVILSAGSMINLTDDDVFEVYTNDYSLSKTKPLTISVGKVKFESDIDENYSICKVVEGGDKINQLINQKEKVYCRLVKTN